MYDFIANHLYDSCNFNTQIIIEGEAYLYGINQSKLSINNKPIVSIPRTLEMEEEEDEAVSQVVSKCRRVRDLTDRYEVNKAEVKICEKEVESTTEVSLS